MANFHAERTFDTDTLLKALNSLLPEDIGIKRAGFKRALMHATASKARFISTGF